MVKSFLYAVSILALIFGFCESVFAQKNFDISLSYHHDEINIEQSKRAEIMRVSVRAYNNPVLIDHLIFRYMGTADLSVKDLGVGDLGQQNSCDISKLSKTVGKIVSEKVVKSKNLIFINFVTDGYFIDKECSNELSVYTSVPDSPGLNLQLRLVGYKLKNQDFDIYLDTPLLSSNLKIVPEGHVGIVAPDDVLLIIDREYDVLAFKIRSTSAEQFSFGSPSWSKLGIKGSGLSGGIVPGAEHEIRIQIDPNLPAGNYRGIGVVVGKDGVVSFPIMIRVLPKD